MNPNVRQRLPYVTREIRRRFSNAMHTRAGHETLNISRLISPLRYDVLVRAQYFDFLSRHEDKTVEQLIGMSRDEPYFVWFENVECARFFPELRSDREAMMARFDTRVRGALATWASYRANGFLPRSPVILLTASPGTPSDSGAPAINGLHIGDGCHRLALLLTDGQELEPWMHQVRPATRTLQDNTAILSPKLGVDEAAYARFLSAALVEGSYSDLASLRSAVGATNAERLDDFDQVVSAQRRP